MSQNAETPSEPTDAEKAVPGGPGSLGAARLSSPQSPAEGVSRTRLALALSVPLGLLAAACVHVALWGPRFFYTFLGRSPTIRRAFREASIPELVDTLGIVALFCAVVFLSGQILGMFRKKFVLSHIRRCYVFFYVLVLFYAYVVFRITGFVEGKELEFAGLQPEDIDAVIVFYWRWNWLSPAAAAALLVSALHVVSWRRAASALYAGVDDGTPAVGDQIIENVRTHGRDPRHRKSLFGSVGTHVSVIVLIPALLRMYGCIENYRVPKGSGNPVVALVARVKPRKEKEKKKKYVLRPDSAIYFRQPDLDDSDVLKDVEQITQLVYEADRNAVHGAMGAGGGKEGGWPDGMDRGEIRFIRLEYRGANWDDGMDAASRADVNFLDEVRKVVPFKVRRYSESHPIRYLKKYDKGYAPPFVYMTGSGGISVSRRDMKILRAYLLGGGMLFADCGSRGWDGSFRSFVRVLFPDKPLRVISDDDPLFRMPYVFAGGPPPLWHHGGSRSLGIKHGGRWVVFYFPGDLNDAWKTGHSGLSPHLARSAYQLGINIMYYSFTQYLEKTREYRK